MARRGLALLFLLTCFYPRAATPQGNPPPGQLESFVQDVARLWAAEDVDGLIRRIPADPPFRLDTGTGTVDSSSRHAAAALRDLFRERETIAASAVQVTLASNDPPAGFGELAWTFRDRGAPSDQIRSVYVAAEWRSGAWRIAELRLLP